MSGPLLSLRLNGRDNVGSPFGGSKGQRPGQSHARTNSNESSLGKPRPTSAANGSLHKQAVKQLHSRKQSEKNPKAAGKTNTPKTNDTQRKLNAKAGSRPSRASQSSFQNQSKRVLRSDATRSSQNHSRSTVEPDSDMMQEDILEPSGGFDELTPMKRIPKQGPTPLQSFTEKDVHATGPLFADPGAIGFMKRQQIPRPRPSPRYMLIQPRLLKKPHFKQDEWDRLNQEKMIRMEEANNGTDFQGLYEEFQKMREVERSKMELLGLVDAENTTKDLNDAIFFQGTCLDMCPTFERVRRALENNVKALEKDFASQKISRARAVKAFSRPAAGQPPPMPSDVRPPHILSKTLDYLIGTILPQLPDSHSFIWDRTRSIRQDFVYQNYYGPEAIDCNEKIVRIHLLCMHVMASANVEFSHQQEMEQFNKALQTLMEMYQDVRNHGGVCPNEAEFRAYHLLSHFRDPELEREIQTLPGHVFNDRQVQLALQFRLLMSQNNIVERGYTNKIGAANMFVKFFELAFSESTPVLMGCLLETHFNEIRFYALKSLSRSYHTGGKALLGSALEQMLGFDSMHSMVNFVHYYEVETFTDEENVLLVDLCNKEKLDTVYKLKALTDKPKRSPATSEKIDARLRRQPLKSYVNAGLPNTDLKINDTYANIILNQQSAQKVTSLDATTSSIGTKTAPFASQTSFGANALPFGASTTPIGTNKAPFGNNSTSMGNINAFGMNSPTTFGATPNAFGAISNNAFGTIPNNSLGGITSNISSGGFGSVQSNETQPSISSAPSSSSSFGQSTTSEVAKSTSFKLSNFVTSSNSNSFTQNMLGQFDQKPTSEPSKIHLGTESVGFPVNVSSHDPIEQKPLNFGSNLSTGNALESPIFGFGTAVNVANKLREKDKDKDKKEKKPQEQIENQILGKNVQKHLFFSTSKPEEATPQFKVTSAQFKEDQKESQTSPHVHFASPPNVVQVSSVAEEPNKSNQNSPKHDEAVGSFCKELASSVEDLELLSTVSKINSESRRVEERQKIIDLFSQELFLAFISEVAFQVAMECTADHFHAANVRKRFFRRIVCLSKDALRRKTERESRLNELQSITFKTPATKRGSKSATPAIDAPPKRRRTESSDVRYSDIHQRQDEIKSLWEPLDLEKFVSECAQNVSELPQSPMKCWFVVENWSLAYSNWIVNKFSLKMQNSLYVNEVEYGGMKVKFEELLNKTLLDSKAMQDSAFLVFECGLVHQASLSKYKDLETKLKRDSATLAKIVQICNRFCAYKVQILVVVWDGSDSKMAYQLVGECLNVNKIINDQNCVQDVSLCYMSGQEQDVTQLLKSQLHHIATNFTSQLTAKGLRQKQLARASALSTLATAEKEAPRDIGAVSTHIQEKEKEILQKGRDSQLRGYLSRHLGRNTSIDLTNTTAFKTPNTSFANRSMANQNKSYLTNTSLSFLGRDASFFKSFANGTILEESTPAASPRPKPSALPKKILDLRKLTASIRERYKSH